MSEINIFLQAIPSGNKFTHITPSQNLLLLGTDRHRSKADEAVVILQIQKHDQQNDTKNRIHLAIFEVKKGLETSRDKTS